MSNELIQAMKELTVTILADKTVGFCRCGKPNTKEIIEAFLLCCDRCSHTEYSGYKAKDLPNASTIRRLMY